MKKFYSLIILCLLTAACQQQGVPGNPTDGQPSNIGKTVFYSADDEPLTFLPSVDSSAWTALRSLDERFDACSVPDDLLRRMTTDALVGSAVNYPLNYLILFNDPESAVEMIFENSPLHRELASRQDAPTELAELFSESDYGFDIKTDLDDRQLSYTDEMFLEYLISSDRIAGRADAAAKDLLRDAVSEKAMQRLSEPDRYSIVSVEPLMAIDRAADLMLIDVKDAKEPKVGTNAVIPIGMTTVTTPLGKTLQAYINQELTNSEIVETTNECLSNYPNAILHGSATAMYNCHSYAWYENTTDNQVWINAYATDGSLQLSNYWTRDVYTSCSENAAVRAFYNNYDYINNMDTSHSAIILPNGKYLSKWGAGPLMEHDKADCPYEADNIQFYNFITSYHINLLSINGDASVGINEYNTYYLTPRLPQIDFEWEVRYMDAEEPKPYEFIEDSNGAKIQYRLLCKDYGLFKINVYGRYQGHTVLFAQLNVVATPQ